MEIERIRELIEQLTALMDAKKLDELEVELEGVKVALRRGSRGGDRPAVVGPHHPAPPPGPAAPPAAEAPPPESDVYVLRSPMVGTFYRSPAPDADPYVEVGDEVGPESVLCIIEAMKVMNELKAEAEGTVVAILVENGEPVEYGQPLFHIAPRKP